MSARRPLALVLTAAAALAAFGATQAAPVPADTVFLHGKVYTADAKDDVRQAFAGAFHRIKKAHAWRKIRSGAVVPSLPA
jgi:hypothetical protein